MITASADKSRVSKGSSTCAGEHYNQKYCVQPVLQELYYENIAIIHARAFLKICKLIANAMNE